MAKKMTLTQLLGMIHKGDWCLIGNSIRHKRSRDRGNNPCCPISWAYQKLKHKKSYNLTAAARGSELGLPDMQVAAVMMAADMSLEMISERDSYFGQPKPPQAAAVRKKILKAAGLQEKA